MHTNTCQNKKYIFYKMVYDLKFIMIWSYWCCAESSGCKMSRPSYNHKACSVVTKWEGPILKWVGLRNGLVQPHCIPTLAQRSTKLCTSSQTIYKCKKTDLYNICIWRYSTLWSYPLTKPYVGGLLVQHAFWHDSWRILMMLVRMLPPAGCLI